MSTRPERGSIEPKTARVPFDCSAVLYNDRCTTPRTHCTLDAALTTCRARSHDDVLRAPHKGHALV